VERRIKRKCALCAGRERGQGPWVQGFIQYVAPGSKRDEVLVRQFFGNLKLLEAGGVKLQTYNSNAVI
jgi:hypothetical protein